MKVVDNWSLGPALRYVVLHIGSVHFRALNSLSCDTDSLQFTGASSVDLT